MQEMVLLKHSDCVPWLDDSDMNRWMCMQISSVLKVAQQLFLFLELMASCCSQITFIIVIHMDWITESERELADRNMHHPADNCLL